MLYVYSAKVIKQRLSTEPRFYGFCAVTNNNKIRSGRGRWYSGDIRSDTPILDYKCSVGAVSEPFPNSRLCCWEVWGGHCYSNHGTSGRKEGRRALRSVLDNAHVVFSFCLLCFSSCCMIKKCKGRSELESACARFMQWNGCCAALCVLFWFDLRVNFTAEHFEAPGCRRGRYWGRRLCLRAREERLCKSRAVDTWSCCRAPRSG